MPKITQVELGDHFDKFIAGQIENGRYSSVDDVLCAALRLLETKEQKTSALRQALIDGENSGDAGPLDMQEIIRKAKKQVDSSTS